MKQLTLHDEMKAKVQDAKAKLIKATQSLEEEKRFLENADSRDWAQCEKDVRDAQEDVKSAQEMYNELVAKAKIFEK